MIHLTFRTRTEIQVTDRALLLASAQEIALRTADAPMPVDIPGALRCLLSSVDQVDLAERAADYGLGFGILALVITNELGEEGWTERPFPGVDAPVIARAITTV